MPKKKQKTKEQTKKKQIYNMLKISECMLFEIDY